MPSRVNPATAALASVLLLIAACNQAGADATPSPDGDTEVTVTLRGSAFQSPDGGETLTISAGATVTFVNEDSFSHTATHGENGLAASDAAFDIGLAAGANGSFIFDEPGSYPVTCKIHPTMNMTITVE